MEKPCQLRIALGLLVTVSVEPTVENVAVPETTAGPVGLAYANSAAKQEATASEMSLRSSAAGARRDLFFTAFPCHWRAAILFARQTYCASGLDSAPYRTKMHLIQA